MLLAEIEENSLDMYINRQSATIDFPFLKCNFPMTPCVRPMVGWKVGRLVSHNFLKVRNFHFHTSIVALVHC